MLISYVGLWSSWKQRKEIACVWAWNEIRTAVNHVIEVSRGKTVWLGKFYGGAAEVHLIIF